MPDAGSQASSLFPATEWARVAKAAAAETRELDELIRRYWDPLRIFLVASFPQLRGQAEILIQEFAEDKMLKAGWLGRADRNRGRFRDFLKASLRNFVRDRLNLADAKRPFISLEELETEPAEPSAASDAFDLAWVRTVLAEALRRMEADCRDPAAAQPRRAEIWEMFHLRLLDPVLNQAAVPPYAELVRRFGLRSPSEASNLLLSAKRIFKSHLDRVIREYAGQDAATAAEVQALQSFIDGLSEHR